MSTPTTSQLLTHLLLSNESLSRILRTAGRPFVTAERLPTSSSSHPLYVVYDHRKKEKERIEAACCVTPTKSSSMWTSVLVQDLPHPEIPTIWAGFASFFHKWSRVGSSSTASTLLVVYFTGTTLLSMRCHYHLLRWSCHKSWDVVLPCLGF